MRYEIFSLGFRDRLNSREHLDYRLGKVDNLKAGFIRGWRKEQKQNQISSAPQELMDPGYEH